MSAGKSRHEAVVGSLRRRPSPLTPYQVPSGDLITGTGVYDQWPPLA